MGHVISYRKERRVPGIVTETVGYPILFGLAALFVTVLWVGAVAEAAQNLIDGWTGKERRPESRIIPFPRAPATIQVTEIG